MASTNMVDAKLPLPWLIGSVVAICLTAGGAMVTLQQLRDDVLALKIDVKTSSIQMNAAQSQANGDLTILKWRVEQLESKKDKGSK